MTANCCGPRIGFSRTGAKKKKAKKRQEKFAKFVGEKKYIENTSFFLKKIISQKKGQEKKKIANFGTTLWAVRMQEGRR